MCRDTHLLFLIDSKEDRKGGEGAGSGVSPTPSALTCISELDHTASSPGKTSLSGVHSLLG